MELGNATGTLWDKAKSTVMTASKNPAVTFIAGAATMYIAKDTLDGYIVDPTIAFMKKKKKKEK